MWTRKLEFSKVCDNDVMASKGKTMRGIGKRIHCNHDYHNSGRDYSEDNPRHLFSTARIQVPGVT